MNWADFFSGVIAGAAVLGGAVFGVRKALEKNRAPSDLEQWRTIERQAKIARDLRVSRKE